MKNEALIAAINNFNSCLNANLSQEEIDKIDIALLEELKKARLFAPIITKALAKPDLTPLHFDEDKEISFIFLEDENDDKFYPAFSDLQKLKDFSFENAQVLELSINDYANIFLKEKIAKGIVINPAEQSFIMDKNMILSVGKKSVFESVGKNEELVFITPNSLPQKLLQNLSEFFSQIKEVKQANFMLIKKDGKNGFLFIIDHHYEDEIELFNDIYALSNSTFKDELVYIVSSKEEIFKNASRLTKAFYEKKEN